MALEIIGNLWKVMPEQSGAGKNGTWVKQDFIIETDDQYPKKVCITAWGEKADELKKLKLFVDLAKSDYRIDRFYPSVSFHFFHQCPNYRYPCDHHEWR